MDSPGNEPIRQYLMQHANLVSAIRLPSNTFTQEAGTEVGSDLIVLQKNTGKTGLADEEKCFVKSIGSGDSIALNSYYSGSDLYRGINRIIYTKEEIGSDPYGKRGIVFTHEGGVDGIALDLRRKLSQDIDRRLDFKLYNTHNIRSSMTPKAIAIPVESVKPAVVYASPAVQHYDPIVAQNPVHMPVLPQRPKRRTRKNQDTSGMLDLFSQPNLRIENTQAFPQPAESFDPRPYNPKDERPTYYQEGTMVFDQDQVGFLKGVYRTSATFQPLDMAPAQKLKAERYIKLRDAYERLYESEASTFEENQGLRQELNYTYNRFVNHYGDLNKKDNANVILMDANGRGILSLERFTEGKKKLADIFDHPVAFSKNEITHVDTATEALAVSLNKYGKVSLGYMLHLTGMKEEKLLEEIGDRLYFDPFLKEYQIADQFIVGNVLEKADKLREYLKKHPDDNRVVHSLEAIEKAIPRQIPFEELDFNFGER